MVGGFGLVARCLAHCVLPEVSGTEAGTLVKGVEPSALAGSENLAV
jgi:hypothetical protein